MLDFLFNWRVWLAAFVVWFLITRPASAAGVVHKGTGAVSHAFNSFGTFVSHL